MRLGSLMTTSAGTGLQSPLVRAQTGSSRRRFGYPLPRRSHRLRCSTGRRSSAISALGTIGGLRAKRSLYRPLSRASAGTHRTSNARIVRVIAVLLMCRNRSIVALASAAVPIAPLIPRALDLPNCRSQFPYWALFGERVDRSSSTYAPSHGDQPRVRGPRTNPATVPCLNGAANPYHWPCIFMPGMSWPGSAPIARTSYSTFTVPALSNTRAALM